MFWDATDQKIDHVQIVAVGNNSSFREIFGHEQFRPASCSAYCSPYWLPSAREAMDEEDAAFSYQSKETRNC